MVNVLPTRQTRYKDVLSAPSGKNCDVVGEERRRHEGIFGGARGGRLWGGRDVSRRSARDRPCSLSESRPSRSNSLKRLARANVNMSHWLPLLLTLLDYVEYSSRFSLIGFSILYA
ncbi:unnamed protein product [Chrysodeixis includens]|uniref:Uncharacterized protein n=1 Tax=Chrysodeixis includens TaxID=689277 RepID=A0A9P0BPK4_CHRIL|nr:unnamed protein product [Chrysodeixis includens]